MIKNNYVTAFARRLGSLARKVEKIVRDALPDEFERSEFYRAVYIRCVLDYRCESNYCNEVFWPYERAAMDALDLTDKQFASLSDVVAAYAREALLLYDGTRENQGVVCMLLHAGKFGFKEIVSLLAVSEYVPVTARGAGRSRNCCGWTAADSWRR